MDINTSVLEKEGIHTCAVVVGISKYESSAIPNLKFSSRDARRFEMLLREFGVDNIFPITDENATRKGILEYLGKKVPLQFNTVSGKKRLIIFFSGHGYREEFCGRLPESCLLTYDTDASNKTATGLTLQVLIQAISRSEPDEVFIFIDACSVAFDNLPNIFTETTMEKEVFTASKAKHLIVYVASAGMAAFEDPKLEAGVFTDCLIRNIRNIQCYGGSTADLVNRVTADLSAAGKQNPFFYSLGNTIPWIFSTSKSAASKPGRSPSRQRLHIDRTICYMQLCRFISHSNKPVYIIGESGVGKSTFGRQLCLDGFGSAYLTISDSEQVTAQSVISDLAYQSVDIFPSGRPMESMDATLQYFKDHALQKPVIIDHTERNGCLTRTLYDKFAEFSIRAIFIGRNLCIPLSQCAVWKCPKLLPEEVSQFLGKLGTTPEEILEKCGGLPIRLIDLLSSQADENTETLAHCMDALSATGGYVDERIFRTTFRINSKTLDQLISSGKVTALDDRCIPHDSIIKKEHKISVDNIFAYWEQQVEKTPTHAWACKQFVTAIIELDTIRSLQSRESKSLQLAIKRLFESREWDLLKALSSCLMEKYPGQYDSLLLLAKIFVHRSNNVIVAEIMTALEGAAFSFDQSNLRDMIEAERLWWIGEYEKAKGICVRLLDRPISKQLQYECKMHMGVADFFLGNWAEALASFSFTEDILNPADPQVNAWALYLSATIIGLRGTDIQKGKEQFCAGIRLLEQIGDDSGTASAWGNMAEMNWKLRDYAPALAQAKRGYSIAKQTDHIIDQIEITRNILHICFRIYSPFDPSVDAAMKTIDSLISKDIGSTVDMQVWNTYATLYAYRGDVENLREMIAKAFPHTHGNREYHIYTLSNICLLDILEGDSERAIRHYRKAWEMANDGKNLLAIRQINDDIIYLNRYFNSTASKAVLAFVKPYIDKVEKQIQIQLKESA